MATAKKTAAKAPAAPAKKTTKATPIAKTPVKTSAKTAVKTAAKTTAKTAAKPAAKPVVKKAPAPAAALKPIKTAFTKTSLTAHLAEQAGVDAKAAKAVMAALETTILASIHKKGMGEFTLPGLLKISALAVPAKKARKGKDPFTGVERMFAAKPASTKIKTRALKKLKDAAL